MARLRDWLTPNTLEQAVGIGMLLTAALMILRPYAAGMDALFALYGIQVSPRAFGALLALCGGCLIGLRRVGRKTFALLYLPVPIYALSLLLSFLNSPTVGPLGTAACVGLALLIPWTYANRATRRERESA